MADFFKSLSKNALAVIIIGVGVLFIVASDPPVTKCSHQIKKFEEEEVGNLIKDKKAKFQEETRFQKLMGICKAANNLGGCFQLFSSIRESLERGRTISLDCQGEWGNSSVVKTFLHESTKIMVELPWGPGGPSSDVAKLSWFQSPQIQLFCRLQNVNALVYGEEGWAQKREALLAGLPNYNSLGRAKAWGLSLFSVSCSNYGAGGF